MKSFLSCTTDEIWYAAVIALPFGFFCYCLCKVMSHFKCFIVIHSYVFVMTYSEDKHISSVCLTYLCNIFLCRGIRNDIFFRRKHVIFSFFMLQTKYPPAPRLILLRTICILKLKKKKKNMMFSPANPMFSDKNAYCMKLLTQYERQVKG